MVLYAKGEPHWTTLEAHIEDCLKVFRSVREAFPYLASLAGESGFWKHLFFSLLFHDLGKAASGFQESLKGGTRWNYRHELLSAGFALNLDFPERVRFAIATTVAASHHGYTHLWSRYRTTTEGGRQVWIKKVSEVDPNRDELKRIMDRFPQLAEQYLGDRLPSVAKFLGACQDVLERCIRPLCAGEADLANRDYHTLLRGLAIACDHLASAHLLSIRQLRRLHEYVVSCHEIRKNGLLSFQEKAWHRDGSCIIQAPTGAGKTAAALLWAAGNQDAARRIFYALPYVASINAMQREFADRYRIPQEDIGILHHRALYFIYKSYLEDGTTEVSEARKKAQAIHDQTRKIYRPIKILTPYQLIKPFYGIKGFEVLLAEMAGGLFIFDEIHAYEPRVVGLVVRLREELRRLGGKCVFMSATMPSFLRDLLSNTGAWSLPLITLDASNAREKTLMQLPRHLPLHVNGEIVDNLKMIRKTLKAGVPIGRKALVVCNSIERAQTVYTALRSNAENPRLIHSRFVAADRERIEREVQRADLLVGTQAIEVSLNFSFPVLFSEPAPVDALLQRMGRLNRFGESSAPAPAYVFSEGSSADEYVYDQDRVRATMRVLPDGSPLTNGQAAVLVEEVYGDGYSDDERREYEESYGSFNDVIAALPLYDESDFKDEFFELIKAVEAVPKRFYQQHRELLREGRYLDAAGLVLPISFPQWSYLRREGRAWKEDGHWYIDAKYDPVLGLIVREREERDTIV